MSLNVIKITFYFTVVTCFGYPQATVNRLKPPHCMSSYVILHATTARCRCSRMYARTSSHYFPCIQGIHARLGRAMQKGNTVWMPQYESSMSEVWAYILKQRRCAVVACNMTYELIQCGGFNRLTVAWGWPYRAETCHNSKIKCDCNDI
jgi:hypothetical protein